MTSVVIYMQCFQNLKKESQTKAITQACCVCGQLLCM